MATTPEAAGSSGYHRLESEDPAAGPYHGEANGRPPLQHRGSGPIHTFARDVAVRMSATVRKIEDSGESMRVEVIVFCLYHLPECCDGEERVHSHGRCRHWKIVNDVSQLPWHPHLVLRASDTRDFVPEMCAFNLCSGVCVYLKSWSADMYVSLDLKAFPFDQQLLPIRLFCTNARMMPQIDLSFAAWAGGPGWWPDLPFVIDSLCEMAVQTSSWHVDEVEPLRFSSSDFSSLSTTWMLAHVQRSSHFFLWNIIIIMFLIVCIQFACIGIHLTNFADRAQFCVTLFLTAVAFKLAVAQSLPPLSYLTFMDKYIIVCFVVLSAFIVESLIVSHIAHGWGSEALAQQVDFWFYIVSSASWGVFHVWLFCKSGVADVLAERKHRRLCGESGGDDEREPLSKGRHAAVRPVKKGSLMSSMMKQDTWEIKEELTQRTMDYDT